MDIASIIWEIIKWIGILMGYLSGLTVLKKRLEPKPDLKVLEVELVKSSSGPVDILDFKLINDGQLMATGVTCRWVINRADTKERVADSSRRTTEIGIIAPHSPTTTRLSCRRIEPSHSYKIWIWLSCNERLHKPIEMPLKMPKVSQV